MSRPLTLLVALLLSTTALAGCLGGSDEAADDAAGKTGTGNDTGALVNGTPQVDDGTGAPDASRDHMPHVHNYWGGQDRMTLVDDEFDLDPVNAAFWTVFTTWLLKEPIAGGFFWDPDEGPLVYEGTGKMEITVAWTDPTVTGMRFVYKHAGESDITVNWIPLTNGAPHTLEVTPEMTDMAHGKDSRWFFIFGAAGTPSVAIGKVHLKIDIVRVGDLHALPGHPDMWQGAEAVTILEADGVSKSRQGPQALLKLVLDPLSPPEDMVPGDKPVPMETATLVATVTVKSVNPDTLKIDHLHLFFKPANGLGDPEDGGFIEADEGERSEDGLTWTWRIPVEMQQTDSPYAEKSAWAYRVSAGYAAPVPGAPPCDDGCYNAELNYHLTVVAEKGTGAA